MISQADDDLDAEYDFGVKVEKMLKAKSHKLFEVEKLLTTSAPATNGAYRAEVQPATDNPAFQPVTTNLYVIEDHPNGDIFACLPDGTDRDIKSEVVSSYYR